VYTSFYGFTTEPFQLSPDPRFFFQSLSHKKAMAYLTYGLNRNEGFIVISGDTGKGKTTLAQKLLSGLDSETYLTAHLVTTQLEPTDLLKLVANRFGVNGEDGGKAAVIERLTAFLETSLVAGRRPLLIVDEAQNLSTGALEELRMLCNIQHDYHSALQIIFLAQPKFIETISQPELGQFRERIIASIDLGSLSRRDTEGYIQHRLSVAGWSGDPAFLNKALDLIYGYTKGLPRRVNKLCDRILLMAALDKVHDIDATLVEKVTDELRDDPNSEFAAWQSEAPADWSFDATEDDTAGQVERRLAEIERDLKDQDRLLKQLLDLFMEHLRTSRTSSRRPDHDDR
jgi:putative secretion ATPase (PEP-CTERM system associated)